MEIRLRTNDPPAGLERSLLSRMLSMIDAVASKPAWAALVLSFNLAWLAYSIAFGFPSRLETIFQTLVAALTLGMVFVIQHTQARQQAATQRKLDEILLALPHANNSVVSLEHASDSELSATGQSHRQRRQDAVAADKPNGRR